MKSIKTLIPDIYARLVSKEKFKQEETDGFAVRLSDMLSRRLSEPDKAPTLRLSNLGTKCDRKLWYSINTPEMAEPLSPSTRFKFLFGDILEELVLFLAKSAGHTVEKEQAEVNVNGVRGHIDAVIDGELVDVKSASPSSFEKFKSGGLVNDDTFGYLDQLGSYRTALKLPRAHFIAVHKVLGKLALDTHTDTGKDYDKLVDEKRKILAQPSPPPRGYSDKADGKSGNRKLGVACSYCPFKRHCFPGLRGYSYSRGPVFLTRVVREPDVPELDLNVPEE